MVRAAETAREDGLFIDPFAQLFLDAAVAQGWRNPYGTEAWHRNDYEDPATAAFRQASTDCAVCRTRFIDDFLSAGTERQVVLLAAGLDTRAWRLPLAEDCAIYELDQPGVLDFKLNTVAEHAGQSLARRCAVPIDLRYDWPQALTAAGFDASVSTAWVAEGLLPYLPPVGQDLLFERINALSAPGSRLVVDVYGPEFYEPDRLRAMFARMNETTREEVYSSEELFFSGDRANVAEWLAGHGWMTEVSPTADVMAELGRAAPDGMPPGALSDFFLTAYRTAQG